MFLKMSSGRNVYFVFLKREITKNVKLKKNHVKKYQNNIQNNIGVFSNLELVILILLKS